MGVGGVGGGGGGGACKVCVREEFVTVICFDPQFLCVNRRQNTLFVVELEGGEYFEINIEIETEIVEQQQQKMFFSHYYYFIIKYIIIIKLYFF